MRVSRKSRSLLFFLILLLLSGPAPFAQQTGKDSGPAEPLRVAAVQFQIRRSDLRSMEIFGSRVRELVVRSMVLEPDLIVFPEYTCVFAAIIPYYDEIQAAADFEEGLRRIQDAEPLIRSLRDLFLLNAGLVERVMEEIFAKAAREHGVAILAGSYFAIGADGGNADLVNRAVVFGKDGRILYTQDKVFLTPFETELLGLSAGLIDRASPFSLEGRSVGLTICRDTFFPAWIPVHAGADLWIDIKANGTRFTEQERQRFLRALPARISEGQVPYGLTVCLTGSLMDLVWEGPSSVARKLPSGEIRLVEEAASASREEILFFAVPGRFDCSGLP